MNHGKRRDSGVRWPREIYDVIYSRQGDAGDPAGEAASAGMTGGLTRRELKERLRRIIAPPPAAPRSGGFASGIREPEEEAHARRFRRRPAIAERLEQASAGEPRRNVRRLFGEMQFFVRPTSKIIEMTPGRRLEIALCAQMPPDFLPVSLQPYFSIAGEGPPFFYNAAADEWEEFLAPQPSCGPPVTIGPGRQGQAVFSLDMSAAGKRWFTGPGEYALRYELKLGAELIASYTDIILATRRAATFSGDFFMGRPRQHGLELLPRDHPLNDPAIWPFAENECGFFLGPGCDERLENKIVVQLQAANGGTGDNGFSFPGKSSPWPDFDPENSHWSQDDDWFCFQRTISRPEDLAVSISLRFTWGGKGSRWRGDPDQPCQWNRDWNRDPWFDYSPEVFSPVFRLIGRDRPEQVLQDWRRLPIRAEEAGGQCVFYDDKGYVIRFEFHPGLFPGTTIPAGGALLEVAQTYPVPYYDLARLGELKRLLGEINPEVRAAQVLLSSGAGITAALEPKEIWALVLYRGAESAPDPVFWIPEEGLPWLPDRPLALITAGIHAEPSTCAMAVGMAVALADPRFSAAEALEQCSVIIAPQMNPDGFNWGACQCWPDTGRDSNEWWSRPTTASPECSLRNVELQDSIAKIQKGGNNKQIALFVDLHNDICAETGRRKRLGMVPPPVYGKCIKYTNEGDQEPPSILSTIISRLIEIQKFHNCSAEFQFVINYKGSFVRQLNDLTMPINGIPDTWPQTLAWQELNLNVNKEARIITKNGYILFPRLLYYFLFEYPEFEYAYDFQYSEEDPDSSSHCWIASHWYRYGDVQGSHAFLINPEEPIVWGIELLWALFRSDL